MQLVDRHRRIQSIARRSSVHPVAVVPLPFERPYSRAGCRRQLAIKPYWVGLLRGEIVDPRGDPVLVGFAALRVGDDASPDSRSVPAGSEDVPGAPAVPVADD